MKMPESITINQPMHPKDPVRSAEKRDNNVDLTKFDMVDKMRGGLVIQHLK